MRQASKIRVLTLEGSPKERGRIHGETLKPMILEILERYKYLIHLNLQKDPDPLIDYFLSSTNFLSAVKKWAPHLLEEIEGIAVMLSRNSRIRSLKIKSKTFKIRNIYEKNKRKK